MNPMRLALYLLLLSSPSSSMAEATFSDIQALDAAPETAEIAYGDNPLQFGRLWHPGTEAPPVVVLLHGGCWLNAYGVDHVHPLAAALSDAGFAVWAIEYRRLGDDGGGYPGTFDDVNAGINAVATLDNVDATRVVVAGHSAGGHLALWASAEQPALPGIRSPEQALRGGIGLAAIADLERYAVGESSCEKAAAQLIASNPVLASESVRRGISPQQMNRAVPAVLVHASADPIVPLAQSENYAASKKAELHIVPGGHFDVIHPGHESFHALVTAIRSLLDD